MLTPLPEVSRLMIVRIVELSLVQRFLICALGFSLLFGGLYAFQQLDIVASASAAQWPWSWRTKAEIGRAHV